MANRPAPALGLREGDREELARITRSTSVRAGLAQRARIVLAAADGEANERIAARVGVSKVTVLQWRSRYAEHGLKGLLIWSAVAGRGSSTTAGSWRRR